MQAAGLASLSSFCILDGEGKIVISLGMTGEVYENLTNLGSPP
jgi:hypothetical protein